MSGWFDCVMETLPRRRIMAPPPTLAELCVTDIPGTLPCRSASTFWGGATTSSSILSCEIELPTSRLRAAPAVPVTTISSSPSACADRLKSSCTVPPAPTVIWASMAVKPMRSARRVYSPAGTLRMMKRPLSRERVPRPVPTRCTCTEPIGRWLAASVTVPVTVPSCACATAGTASANARRAAPAKAAPLPRERTDSNNRFTMFVRLLSNVAVELGTGAFPGSRRLTDFAEY